MPLLTRLQLLLLVPAVALCGAARSQAFPSVDEAANDPSFYAFRTRVLDAIATKDEQFILSFVSERIRNSFGGDDGIAEFRSMWKLEDDASEFWTKLETVLRLGGTFRTPDEFWAPYVFAAWPRDVDPYEYLAVIGTNVNVRSAPSLAAPVVAKVGFEVVRLVRGDPRADWRKIGLTDGTVGYISGRYVRSPVDYRASFVREGDRWVLRSFVAGD